MIEFKILSENCYHMDEIGSLIGIIQEGYIIIDIITQIKYELEIGCQEWVTLIECICA